MLNSTSVDGKPSESPDWELSALRGNGDAARGGGRQVEFVFRDVNVHINNTHILHDISGIARSGEVLAVMGPSGSGKTTLLNSLAGRTTVTSGEVTLDGHLMTKKVRKRTCYVLQQDIFLSKLTLWETLYFAAMIYLPESLPRAEKLVKIDHIIDVLDLNKCRNTVVGDQLIRGLSGGEKKRLSIACELIKDPDVMFMDEPTSGLDSSTAYTLMQLLKQFTRQSGKVVVVSIHQPSSQIFFLFTHLLLLADGHIAYFGDGHKALDFFEELGLVCEPHFNPADFILETVKNDKEMLQKIIDLAEEKRCTDLWPVELRHSAVGASGAGQNGQCNGSISPCVHSGNVMLYTASDGEVRVSLVDADAGVEGTALTGPELAASETSKLVGQESARDVPQRWATGFWMQFKMLNWRTFKHARTRIISKYNIIHCSSIALFCSLLWFQMPRTHTTVKDRMGFLFFIAVYWSFLPMFDAITSFPGERPVILKERAAGAYRLSAFYFAKMSSELPLILLLPTLFCSATYWMAGLRGLPQFMATWGIMLLNVLNNQSIGYIIGAAIWDLQMCITTASVIILYGLLAAGFYVNRMPVWLSWARYLSLVCYPYNAISILELGDLMPLPCSTVVSFELPMCQRNNTTMYNTSVNALSLNNTSVNATAVDYTSVIDTGVQEVMVPPGVILHYYGIELPIHCYIGFMVIELFLCRSLAYVALKYKKPSSS